MKKIILLFLITFSTYSSFAEDLFLEDVRCLTQVKLDDSLFYLMYMIELDPEETKVTEMHFDSLAENGFYGTWPVKVVSSKFIEFDKLEVEFYQTDNDKVKLKATYNEEKENYTGTVTGFNDGELKATFTCMKFSAF